MKKQIVFAVLTIGAIVLGTNNIKAQKTSTAATTVKMVLADVISMEAPAATQVTFTYDNAAAYNADQKQSVVDNLKVTSTKSFGIEVKADGANFISGANIIPVTVMTVKPVAGGTKAMGGTLSDVPLTTVAAPLVTGAAKGSQVTLNIDYFIPSTESSSDKILGKPAGTYTQTVTYTATAL